MQLQLMCQGLITMEDGRVFMCVCVEEVVVVVVVGIR